MYCIHGKISDREQIFLDIFFTFYIFFSFFTFNTEEFALKTSPLKAIQEKIRRKNPSYT